MLSTKHSNRTGGWAITMLLAVHACSSITIVLARSATASSASSSPSSAGQSANQLTTVQSPSKPYRGVASTHLHRTDEQSDQVAADASAQQAKSAGGGESSIWSELEFVYNTYQQCSDVDLSVCLKLKLVSALNSAARSMQNIEPVEGIRFVSLNEAGSAKSGAETAAVSDQELLATLPRSVEGQESALSSMIWDRIAAFFQTHTVQVSYIST